MSIPDNIRIIRERIGQAAERSGRRVDDVLFVVVTKNRPVEAITKVLSTGVRDIGENRVQEFLPKYYIIGDKATWHLVGNLQRNKVAKVVGRIALIHSVDSLKLAEEIGKRATGKEIKQKILLEVNVSGEKRKGGFSPGDLERCIDRIMSIEGISVEGLMTMAPLVEDAEEIRPVFRALARFRDKLRGMGYDMPHLSMGMTNDFEVAVEEGATIVRIGTAVFKA
ncbi:MAG: YggS family pyridoxal phosphate-dependent enzyme [Actinobacteria bacterium]|nr:YggS family pyridoxal phosphate-dependent enzyme [Actinomycetota bacterium]